MNKKLQHVSVVEARETSRAIYLPRVPQGAGREHVRRNAPEDGTSYTISSGCESVDEGSQHKTLYTTVFISAKNISPTSSQPRGSYHISSFRVHIIAASGS